MNPELVKALKAVRNGADPLTAYSAACGTWGNFLRAVKQQSAKCETKRVQRVRKDNAGWSLSPPKCASSCYKRGTRREQPRAS